MSPSDEQQVIWSYPVLTWANGNLILVDLGYIFALFSS